MITCSPILFSNTSPKGCWEPPFDGCYSKWLDDLEIELQYWIDNICNKKNLCYSEEEYHRKRLLKWYFNKYKNYIGSELHPMISNAIEFYTDYIVFYTWIDLKTGGKCKGKVEMYHPDPRIINFSFVFEYGYIFNDFKFPII